MDKHQQAQNNGNTKEESTSIKQAFLAAAISDISAYIQLADAKVSIIMGATVALIVGIMSCHIPICNALNVIMPCTWRGIVFCLFAVAEAISLIVLFASGILTIWSHKSTIDYKSMWFLSRSSKEYSFDSYRDDVLAMSDSDVIENMAAELYKLNDINRQKTNTVKWTVRSFTTTLVSSGVLAIVLASTVIGG